MNTIEPHPCLTVMRSVVKYLLSLVIIAADELILIGTSDVSWTCMVITLNQTTCVVGCSTYWDHVSLI